VKKIVLLPLVVILLLLLTWLGGCWYTKGVVHNELNSFYQDANKRLAAIPDAGVVVREVSRSAGFFTTHVRYGLYEPGREDVAPEIEIDAKISHGPFPLSALAQGTLWPQMVSAHIDVLITGSLKSMSDSILGGKPYLSVDTNCAYSKNECDGTAAIPAMHLDNLMGGKNTIDLGGTKTKYAFKIKSDTDYSIRTDTQLLPISINTQSVGSGQLVTKLDPQGVSGTLSWKIDQNQSKIFFDGKFVDQQVSFGMLRAESLIKFLKAGTLKVDLSKSMIIELGGGISSLIQKGDSAVQRAFVAALVERILADKEYSKYFVVQGDQISSQLQYADRKFLINGLDMPSLAW
jgi:uncharacterized protein YdgA (DUF945 family)